MSNVYLCSDWHLGHANIHKMRGLESAEENTKRLVSGYMETVGKRDVVWFLGDIAFTREGLALIGQLPGDKRLVIGNHDTDRSLTVLDFLAVFKQVHGLVGYKRAWLSHCPMHPDELRGKINIHGHMHGNQIKDGRYYNVCPEIIGWKPITYQQLLGI